MADDQTPDQTPEEKAKSLLNEMLEKTKPLVEQMHESMHQQVEAMARMHGETLTDDNHGFYDALCAIVLNVGANNRIPPKAEAA
jgi:hypothetical protein